MRKSFMSWAVRGGILLLLMLMLSSTIVTVAQEATAEVEAPTEAPTLTEIPSPAPVDLPTDAPAETTPEPPTAPEVTVEPELPTETPIPTQTLAPSQPTAIPTEPPLRLLVRELFDNADISAWENPGVWTLIGSENGLAIQATNTNEAFTYGLTAFYNSAVQASFVVNNGSAQISSRVSDVGSYTAAIDGTGLVQLSRAGIVVQTAVLPPVPPGTWRTLRLSVINDVVRVTVDNVEVIVYVDVTPLPPGKVALSALFADTTDPAIVPGNILVVDNFFLWVPETEYGLYPSPTPLPTVTFTPVPAEPTEVVTETPVTIEPTATLPEAPTLPEATPEVTPESTPEATLEATPEVTPESTPEATLEATPEATLPTEEDIQDGGKDFSMAAPPSEEQLALAQAALNDLFSGFVIPPSALPFPPYIYDGDTTEAAVEAGEPIPTCGPSLGKSVWFSFTPQVTANYALTTTIPAGSTFDTIMAVYTGDAINALTQVACNDDAIATTITSRITMSLTAGVTYRIQLGGFNNRFGLYTFRLEQANVPAPAVPVLNFPAASATVADTTPALKWNASVNAFSYEWQIASANNFAPVALKDSGTLAASVCTTVPPTPSTCTATVTTDLTPGTYFWRVRALNINGVAGAYSAARALIVRTTPPVPSLPAVDATISTAKPTFRWAAYPGAKYTVEISTDNGGTIADSRTNIATTTYVWPTALQQGKMWWRVGATDVLGTPPVYSEWREFTLNISTAPLNNAVITATTANVTFTWAAVPNNPPVTYTLVLDTDPNFGSPSNTYIPTPATALRYVMTGLTAGTYYWYVIPTGFEPTLTPPEPPFVRKFTVNPAVPLAPVLVSPATGSTVFDSTPTLDWNATTTSAGGPFTYEIQIATAANFATDALVVTEKELTDTEYTVPSDLTPKLYYWRVRTVNSLNIAGSYSAARTFTVRTALPTQNLPADDATVTTSKPTFTWAAIPGGVKYTVYIDQDTTPGGEIYTSPLLATTSHALPAAQPALTQGKWYWRVVATDSLGNTLSSESRPFGVSIATLPANNAVINTATTANVTFTWAAVPNNPPVTYTLVLDTDPNFGSPSNTYIPTPATALRYVMTGLTAGTYYWYVIPTGFEPTLTPPEPPFVRKFTVSPTVPVPAPTILTGTNLATLRPKLDWDDVTRLPAGTTLQHYEIQIATNAAFTPNPPFVTSPISEYEVPYDLNTGTTYYWRVRTVNNLKAPGAFSPTRTFIIRTTPPTLSAPANSATLITPRPTLVWAAYPTATQYHILLRQTDQCETTDSSAIFDFASTAASFPLTPANMPQPLSQGEWHWCVAAKDRLDNWTPYSVARKFTVNLLSTPAANVVTPITKPTFVWGAVTVAAGQPVPQYRLEIDDSEDFDSVDYTSPALTITRHTLPTNIPGSDGGYGTYHWRVLVSLDGGTTWLPAANAPYRKFTISPAAPPASVLVSPATGSSHVAMPLLDWNPPPNTVKGEPFTYDVQIATSNTFANIVQTATDLTDSQYQVSPALGEGTYFWRVRVYNKYSVQSAAYSAVRTFIIDTSGTAAPTLSLPADNSPTTVKQPTFTWTKPLGAVRYEIRYTTNYDPATYDPVEGLQTTGTFQVNNITALNYKPPSPLLVTIYYWQVRAYDAAGNPSPWSAVRALKINSATTESPVPYRFGPSDPILLTWGPLSWAALPGGYYELQIDNNPLVSNNFPSPEYQRTLAKGNQIEVAEYSANNGVIVPAGFLPDGLPNGTWYWRVRGYNPTTGQYGAWSNVGRFTVEK